MHSPYPSAWSAPHRSADVGWPLRRVPEFRAFCLDVFATPGRRGAALLRDQYVEPSSDSERTGFFDERDDQYVFILDRNGWAFVAGAESDGQARFVELPPVLIMDEVWRLPTNGAGMAALRALARRSRSPLPLQRRDDLGIDVDLDLLARATGRPLPERRPLQIWQRLEDLYLGIDAEAVLRHSSAIIFPRAGGAPVDGEPGPGPDGR